MKFLIDHQLPPALARFLESAGHTAWHVRDLGLKESNDLDIWRHAQANYFVVISKDEDFFFFASSPDPKTKLIWVRIGNCRTAVLLERFRARLSEMVAALEARASVVELR